MKSDVGGRWGWEVNERERERERGASSPVEEGREATQDLRVRQAETVF